jgi:Flp pilus assembly protein TadD
LWAEFPRPVLEFQDLYQPKSLVAGLTYLVMGDGRKAAAECGKAQSLLETETAKNPRDPRLHTAMAQALACLGRKDEALREARLGMDLAPISRDAMEGVGHLENLAWVQVVNGDLPAASETMARVLETPGSISPTRVRLDPVYAPLLAYPPFKKVMEKYP